MEQSKGLFITGTDTNVGKTLIGQGIVQYLRSHRIRVGAYKPVASGIERNLSGDLVWCDVEAYFTALEGRFPRASICPQCFEAPLAPPIAARHEGRTVDEQLLASGIEFWRENADVVIVEGAGGWLSPLSDNFLNADLAQRLNYPVVVVARLGLGTINHTLLTLEAIRRRSLDVAGIILSDSIGAKNDQSIHTNPETLEHWTDAKVLGVLPHLSGGDLLQHPAFLRIIQNLEIIGRFTDSETVDLS